jgi:hypothetical protein
MTLPAARNILRHLLPILLIILPFFGCTFAKGEIVITRLPKAEVQATKSPKFDQANYRSILVILPDAYNRENTVMAGGNESPPPKEKRADEPKQGPDIPHPSLTLSRSQDYDYVVNQAEHYLLQQNFNIISRDVIARIDEVESPRYGKKSYLAQLSPTQLALLLGQRTNADAILVISNVGAWPMTSYYMFDDHAWSFQSRPMPQDSEGTWIVFYLWEVTMEAKLIDIRSGEVVWMGNGRFNSRNLFDEDWSGVVRVRGSEVKTISENFRIEDYDSYNFLYKQVSILEKEVLSTLR